MPVLGVWFGSRSSNRVTKRANNIHHGRPDEQIGLPSSPNRLFTWNNVNLGWCVRWKLVDFGWWWRARGENLIKLLFVFWLSTERLHFGFLETVITPLLVGESWNENVRGPFSPFPSPALEIVYRVGSGEGVERNRVNMRMCLCAFVCLVTSLSGMLRRYGEEPENGSSLEDWSVLRKRKAIW